MMTQFHGGKQWAGARAAGFGLIIGLGLWAAPSHAAPEPLPQPRIQKLYNTADPEQDSVFALDSYITLEVRGLERYMQRQEALLKEQNVDADKAHTQARRLVLYINDAPLIGMLPESMHTMPYGKAGAVQDTSAAAQDSTITKLIFHLSRDQNTYKYWNVVYNSPWEFVHPGKIGLGYDDRVITNIYPQQKEAVRLKLVRPVALSVALLVVGLLALVIVQLARKSWLLRNPTPTGKALNGQQPTFSLAKSQLAWWTFLVLGAYLLIFCVTGEMTNISTTTLELLGISAGTAGLGSLLGTPDVKAAKPVPVSQGWWHDVLSDDDGVSMHRLQQVGFTLLLGYLFIRTVYKTVALPDWNDNEIVLLGISSATYLGLKAQENNAAKDPTKDTSTFDSDPTSTAGTATTPTANTTPTDTAAPAADQAGSLVTVNVGTPPPADGTAATSDTGQPATAAGTGQQSSADPVTGAVQFRAEDDMGPDAPDGGPATDAPAENPNQIPG